MRALSQGRALTNGARCVASGCAWEPHSVRHPRLDQLDDCSLQYEVVDSLRDVGADGAAVAFAYPDGAHDDRVVSCVQRAGASSAVTCEPGLVGRGSDRLRLPRVFAGRADYGQRSSDRSYISRRK